MYHKTDKNNAIFNSSEFQKDQYKFNVIAKIRESENPLIYSDGENYVFCRSDEGKPTWIWTKDGIEDKKVLEEIKGVISRYFTDLERDKFTCKKELYDFLVKDNYTKLNQEDYFELGFLICKNTKEIKKVEGHMEKATLQDTDIVAEYIYGFQSEIPTIVQTEIITMEKTIQEAKELIEQGCLFTWRNKEGKVVAIAKYQTSGNTARIGHVYTKKEERNKGYAANLIHDLTDQLLQKGYIPLLYTDYSYPPSNKAYVNAGYEDQGILINFTCSKEK